MQDMRWSALAASLTQVLSAPSWPMRGPARHHLTNQRPSVRPPRICWLVTLRQRTRAVLEHVGQHSGPYLHNVHNVSSETRLMSMFVTPAQEVMALVASGSLLLSLNPSSNANFSNIIVVCPKHPPLNDNSVFLSSKVSRHQNLEGLIIIFPFRKCLAANFCRSVLYYCAY